MNKLNFGCGSIQPDGWVNIDKDPEFLTMLRHTKSLPDDFFDIIVAHAVVQQFEWHSIVQELKELKRILKPGGVIRISLPDIVKGFGQYVSENKEFFPNGEDSLHQRFCAWLTWYSTSQTLLTQPCIAEFLFMTGFEPYKVAFTNYKKTHFGPEEIVELDTREGEFYFIEAQK